DRPARVALEDALGQPLVECLARLLVDSVRAGGLGRCVRQVDLDDVVLAPGQQRLLVRLAEHVVRRRDQVGKLLRVRFGIADSCKWTNISQVGVPSLWVKGKRIGFGPSRSSGAG